MSIVTCDELVPVLTDALADATPQERALLLQALQLPTARQGAFIPIPATLPIVPTVETIACTYTAPAAGVLSVAFSWLANVGVTDASVSAAFALILKNGVRASVGLSNITVNQGRSTICGADTAVAYLPVQAGDVISGVVVAPVFIATYTIENAFCTGLSLHYV